MPDQDRRTQLAVALLRRAEAVLQLPYSPAEAVMRPLFPGGRAMLGAYGIDSLDLVEAMVAIDEDLGVLLIDRVTLVEASTENSFAPGRRTRVEVERQRPLRAARSPRWPTGQGRRLVGGCAGRC